nr:integrase, catalytic region, zinc finger, CCHC-type, peptidase aspartic, catalytic [Tanacetum cinerariifolium]
MFPKAKPATEARKPIPKRNTQNHNPLPAKSVKARRAADYYTNLYVDISQFVDRFTKSVHTKPHQAKRFVNTSTNTWNATKNTVTRIVPIWDDSIYMTSLMRGSEYGEQDIKAVILYEYETFKANEGEELLDTYICYLQVINDLKKCGYKKDNCELNYKFLNNLQPKWKYDVNDALGYKKKAVVITSDPLALVAEKTKMNKQKEKVVVSSDSERSGADDFSELKKITALLAKAFNRRKFYSKPTNNNLRTSSTSQSTNKKQEFVKTNDKKEDKKADEKKRDMSKEINANMVFMAYIEKVHLESDESSPSAEETIAEEQINEFNEQIKVLNEKNADLLAQTEVLQDQLKVKHIVIDTHTECQAQYEKLEEERYEYMIRYSALCDNDKQHRKKIDEQEILFDKMSRQLVEMNNNVLRLQDKILEKETKISELEGCVSNKDVKIEKCLERLNECENKLYKIGQTNQTIHRIMPSKDTLYNGRKGIGFENPSYYKKAKDLRPSLYDERVIGLGYTLMFLIHSNEALEIEKFKRARENKIEFAYDYGNLNASYVNEKIIFLDDYFQEIINPDFEKIDSSFQKKPRNSMNVRSKSNLNRSLPRTMHRWLPKMQPLAEPVAKWIPRIVNIYLWIIDSGCSKHMTGNRTLLTNFVEKFLGTVRFGNNDFAVIAGYGYVVIGSMTIKKVYYVEVL